MTNTDWAHDMFPGDPFTIPSNDVRDAADAVIRRFSEQWGEEPITIARVHPDVTSEGFANPLAGEPTNLAYVRSRLRRWWYGPGKPLANQHENVQQKLSDNPLSN